MSFFIFFIMAILIAKEIKVTARKMELKERKINTGSKIEKETFQMFFFENFLDK